MDTLEKLELKVGQVLSRVKELEKINSDLAEKYSALQNELKICQLKLEQLKEENSDLKMHTKEKEIKVHDKISELLSKLEEVEAEIV